MKKALKILSIALTAVLVMGIFSCATPVFAAEVTEKDSIESTLEQYKSQVENSENKSLYEIREERDEFTKVFRNSDGTKTAIVSATPIHYETSEGWEDIDNTLIEETKVTGKIYKNKKNDFTVTIPKELSSSEKLKIEKDNYAISFELEGNDLFSKNKEIKGNKKNKNENKKSSIVQNEIDTDFLDKTSGITFENVGENTSIEYEVTSTGLKENIILNQKPEESVTYKYKITAKKLTAELNSDNSVTFKNKDGQAIFEIPAPFMYDAENVVSYDIDVSFSGKNGKYTLIYKPSFKWLSGNIEYPVIIDPIINTTDEGLGVKDATVNSAVSNSNYGNEGYLYTYKSDSGNIQSFIDISSNFIVKNGAKIKSVLLGLYYLGGVFIDDTTTVAAYTVTSDWSESTLTYNNKPATINSLIERKGVSKNTQEGYFLFDVTKAYTLKQDTYGVCIRQRDSVTNEAQLIFASSEYQTASQQPFFIIQYYESQGVGEQFDYHAFDVGRAGTAYFNDFTEQVYIERDELGLSGINMPVQIKRYFNSGLGGTYSINHFAYSNVASIYGFGWRTNYSQFIEYHSGVDYEPTILYCNGAGQTTYFKKDSTDSTGITLWTEKPDEFSNSDGYTLYIPQQYENNIQNNLQYVTVKDSSGQIYEFNSYGFLVKINSADENSTNSINIIYGEDDFKIQKIIDGVGREYRFSYTEYEEWTFPLLTSIQAYSPSGEAITVAHNGTNVPYKMIYTYTFSNYLGYNGLPMLASATYPDGETVYYTVNDNLVSLKNIDDYAVEFAFNDNNTVISEKVYSENGTDFTSGGQLTIIDENDYEKTFVDINETKITKQFDMYGRTINTKNNNEINNSVARMYSDDYKAEGTVNYSFYNSYEQNITGGEANLITNGSFTTDLSGWTISSSSKVKRTSDYDGVAENETPGSLQISGVRNDEHYALQKINIENGVSGDEYQLDFFVKNTTHSHMISELLRFDTILIEARNNIVGDETWAYATWVEANPFNSNWQKYSYSFEIDIPYNEIRVTICYFDQYGTVRFDDISLINTYKAPANQNPDVETDNGNTGSSGDNSGTIGCSCAGCNTPNCPCTVHSDTCTLPYCNRGYNFENKSSGITFSLTDGEKTMGMEQSVSGNYYGNQRDLNGIYTGYNYDQMNGQLKSISNGNNRITSYSYDAMNRLVKVSNDVDGMTNHTKMETSYSYENDRIKSISHNDFSYNYEYDDWGNPKAVKIGTQSLVSYDYGDNETNNPKYRDRINRITYGNGDYTDYEYYNDGNIKTIKTYSAEGLLVADYLYSYGESGQIESVKNIIENTEIRYTESGYSFVKLNGEGTADDFEIYSKTDDIDKTIESLAGKEYNITKDEVNSIVETGGNTRSSLVQSPLETYNLSSETDFFGRTLNKDLIYFTAEEEGYVITEKTREAYEYADDKQRAGYTTSLVSSYSITTGLYVEEYDEEIYGEVDIGWFEIYSRKEYLYDYDYNGNITRIRLKVTDEDGDETLTELNSYVYDNVNQLVRENNSELNKTIVYVYDKGGNIAQKKEYAYTTATDISSEHTAIINYTYDSVWKDKLTAYGDTAIQTDSMGNPLNYVGIGINGVETSGTLEWNGRQLSAAVVSGDRFEYTYNSDGLRTSVKDVAYDGTVERIYYYIWENGKLMGYYVDDMVGSDDVVIKLMFDAVGEPLGYEVINDNDEAAETFYFQKNLQGDITAVCNSNRTVLITYSYDAWGGVQVTAINESSLYAVYALLCTPITYRGYNYDIFTGLYYLQSRYYNPAYGRFLNMDSTDILEATQGTPHGANLFAYCNNNPVNYVDYGGRVPGLLLGVLGIIGFLAVFILIVIIVYLINKNTENTNKDFENALELVVKFKELQQIGENYWFAYYYHVKNVIEYGTGANPNPSFDFYDEQKYYLSYKEYCANLYFFAVSNGVVSKTERWEEFDLDRKENVIRQIMGYCVGFKGQIDLYYAKDLKDWGVDTYEVIWGFVQDMAGL